MSSQGKDIFFVFLLKQCSCTEPLHNYNVIFKVTADSVFKSKSLPELRWGGAV